MNTVVVQGCLNSVCYVNVEEGYELVIGFSN